MFKAPFLLAFLVLKAASILLLLVKFSTPALACQFDVDCAVGSQCIKSAGRLSGYCAGGINPGNTYDRQPYRDPLDTTGRKGNTCSFDVDCGPGGQCVKSGIYGVCVN